MISLESNNVKKSILIVNSSTGHVQIKVVTGNNSKYYKRKR